MITKLESLVRKNSQILQTQESQNFRMTEIRKILYMLFEEPSSSRLALFIYSINLVAILLSLAINIVDSYYSNQERFYFNYIQIYIFYQIELVIFIVFLVEYLIRIICCSAYGKTVRQFILEPMNIIGKKAKKIILIDVISFVPFILQIIVTSSKIKGFQIVRIIRFSRVFRIIKLKRYLKGLYLLQAGVSKSFKQFSFLLAGFLMTNMVFCFIILYCEDSEKNFNDQTQINGFYDAFWFCIVTITTVGYGDKTPKTLMGRIFTTFLAFLANTIILPLPIAIIGRDFHEVHLHLLQLFEGLPIGTRIKQNQKNKEKTTDE